MVGVYHINYGTGTEENNFRGRYSNANEELWDIRTKVRYDFSNSLNLAFTYTYQQSWTGLHGGVDLYSTPSSEVFNGRSAYVFNYEAFEKIQNHHYDLTLAFLPSADSVHSLFLSLYSSKMLREYRDEENRVSIPPLGVNGLFIREDWNTSLNGMKVQYLLNSSFNRLHTYFRYEEPAIQTTKKIPNPGTDFVLGMKSDFFLMESYTLSIFGTGNMQTKQSYFNMGSEMQWQPNQQLIFTIGGAVMREYFENHLFEQYASAVTFKQKYATHTLLEADVRLTLDPLLRMNLSYQYHTTKNPFIIDTVRSLTPLQQDAYYFPSVQTVHSISLTGLFSFDQYHLDGTATFLQSPETKRGNITLKLSPSFYLEGMLYYQDMLVKGNLELKAGLRARYISQQDGMRPLDEYGVWIPSVLASFGPSAALDLFANGKIGDAHIQLTWENITNNQYMLAPIYPMNNANFRLNIRWEFFD
jgi:hypothetical protein